MEVYQDSKEIEYINPLELYKSIRGPGTYLLQSIGGEGKKARFTTIGFNPMLTVKCSKNEYVIEGEIKKFFDKLEDETTIQKIRELTKSLNSTRSVESVFTGGLVGFLNYDIVYEKDVVGINDYKPGLSNFSLCRNNIIFDHSTNKTILIETIPENSENKIEDVMDDLHEKKIETTPVKCGDFSPNQTKHEFEESVRVAKNYIKEGDIFQVVLSQKISAKYRGDPFSAYLKLLEVNPSPYMYFLEFDDLTIAGSSPETLVRVEDKLVYTYPIAGTRKRGANAIEDAELEQELKKDLKEQAEHLMLVDLGRNDIGRVSEFGSVEVTKFMQPEYFSHVMHLSSEVRGRLKKDADCLDALESVFPAGTVSGAPKVRAMEIINELEPEIRGPYAGCVGYFSFNQNMDTAITIRTIVFQNENASIQAGAGIVADSIPEMEYFETLNKSNAMIKTLEVKE